MARARVQDGAQGSTIPDRNMEYLSDEDIERVTNMRHPTALEECKEMFANYIFEPGVKYCTAIHDTFLCWPPTVAGFSASLRCPPQQLSDVTEFAHRQCGVNGRWLNKDDLPDAVGWSNYSNCFPEQVRNLFEKVSDPDILNIAKYTRYMELLGITCSLISLLASLLVFGRYRRLHNDRTMIHRHLFGALTLQVLLKLFIYSDQLWVKSTNNNNPNLFWKGIERWKHICILLYVCLEYAITAMFIWMLIEGLYLNSVVTANPLHIKITRFWYLLIGWGLPLVITGIWATITFFFYESRRTSFCWFGYNFDMTFKVFMQGPRIAIIAVNLVILVKILTVVVEKLRRTRSSEIQKARRAARAAIVLLPLLGITNLLNMVKEPLNSRVSVFALWSFTTYFLNSFQGFFISLFYCFLNGEVRQAVLKDWNDFKAMRQARRRRLEQDRRDVEEIRDPAQMNEHLAPYFNVSPEQAMARPWSEYIDLRCVACCPRHEYLCHCKRNRRVAPDPSPPPVSPNCSSSDNSDDDERNGNDNDFDKDNDFDNNNDFDSDDLSDEVFEPRVESVELKDFGTDRGESARGHDCGDSDKIATSEF